MCIQVCADGQAPLDKDRATRSSKVKGQTLSTRDPNVSTLHAGKVHEKTAKAGARSELGAVSG